MEELNKEQGTENLTGWEKFKKFLKDTWTDKVRFSYIVVGILMLLFLIAQFVPIAEGYIYTENSNPFEEEFSKFTVLSVFKKSDGSFGQVFYFAVFVPLALSARGIIAYFISKGKKYGRGSFVWAIVGLALVMFVYLFCYMTVDEYDYTSILKSGHNFYCISAALLFVGLIMACRFIKKAKEEEKIQARVKEELAKEREEEQA